MRLYHKKSVKAIALVGSHQCSIDTVIDWHKSDRAPELLAYAGFKTVDFPLVRVGGLPFGTLRERLYSQATAFGRQT